MVTRGRVIELETNRPMTTTRIKAIAPKSTIERRIRRHRDGPFEQRDAQNSQLLGPLTGQERQEHFAIGLPRYVDAADRALLRLGQR